MTRLRPTQISSLMTLSDQLALESSAILYYESYVRANTAQHANPTAYAAQLNDWRSLTEADRNYWRQEVLDRLNEEFFFS